MNDSLPLPESILDSCINAIYDQGKTVQDCLALYPEQSEAIEPLLRLTERLQASQNLAAPADFRISARERLEKRLSEIPQTVPAARLSTPVSKPVPFSRVPARRPAALPRRAPMPSSWAFAAGLAFIVLMLLVSTTVSYAQRSLPGNPLYGVKIAGEQAQLALAPSAITGAGLHLKFANQRFQEVRALVEEGETTHLQAAVRSYQTEISTTQAYTTSNQLNRQEKARVIVQLAQQLVQNDQDLSAVVANLPKTHPEVPAQTVSLIVNQTRPASDTMHQLYSMLLNEIRDDPNLPKEFKEFESFPWLQTATSPSAGEMTETPRPTYTRILQMPTPGATNPENGGSEWPTSVLTAWPTPWGTDWTTLIPDGTITPPSYLYKTLFPTYFHTYLPTAVPTYRPPEDHETVEPPDGDTWPGWDWPDDFPGDDGGGDGDNPPPGWGWP